MIRNTSVIRVAAKKIIICLRSLAKQQDKTKSPL